MAEASIPVDLFNPGQVFACLGFLEAADVLAGDASGGFDWSDGAETRFCLRSAGEENPFRVVLADLAGARARACAPPSWIDSNDSARATNEAGELISLDTYPAAEVGQMELPVRLEVAGSPDLDLTHWVDGSSRDDFKLYAGNRSAFKIARDMLEGAKTKSSKKFPQGRTQNAGVTQLWRESGQALAEDPFEIVVPLPGTFNFDPRGAWKSIDSGYSPDEQGHGVEGSPVVELLAALGLEHARPNEFRTRQVRYFVWKGLLPPILARPALAGAASGFPLRRFRFTLDLSGKNKVVTIATEESHE